MTYTGKSNYNDFYHRNFIIICNYSSHHLDGRRLKLDRRRLETAHFRYAMLVVASWYPTDLPMPTFGSDIGMTLLEFTPLYHKAFHSNYSGK